MENQVNNYFTIIRLADFINSWLNDFYVAEILKTARSEVQVIFRQKGVHKAMKFYLGEESFVFFPDKFFIPKKSQPFLQQLENKKFIEAVAHPHDRSFRLHFSDNFTLVILLYGRNANLILYQGKAIDTVYNPKIKTNTDKPISFYKNILPATESEFTESVKTAGLKKAIATHFAGFTKSMLAGFDADNLSVKLPGEQFKILLEWEKSMADAGFYIYENKDAEQGRQVFLSLLKKEAAEVFFTTYIYAALNEFARLYFRIQQFNTQKRNFISHLKSRIDKAENQLKSYYFHLTQLETDKNYKHQADLIMANLYAIPKGAEKIALMDFDGSHQLIIKLKREFTAQEWAEKLYQKAKKQQIERAQTESHIANIEKMLSEATEQLRNIQQVTEPKMLRDFLPQALNKSPEKKQQEAVPYKKFEIEGFIVLVGKSAADNDKLTFGIAKKDDLWLHAKDVAGSHVIIQNPSRKDVAKTTLEKAAQLAAYFSKGKGSDLYPVQYTLKKFVRKPKTAGPGKVIIEKEKTLLVEPKLP